MTLQRDIAAREAAYLAEWRQMRDAYAAAHLDRQLPGRYRSVDVDRHRSPKLAAWQPGQSAVLTGASGAGKSHQLALLAKLQHAAGQSVAWFDEVDLLDRLRASAKDPAAYPTQILQSPTVAIDDFGKGRPTEFVIEKVFQLVNHAYQHRRVLLISTELSVHQIADTYGSAVARRLVELSGGAFTRLDVAWWKRGRA